MVISGRGASEARKNRCHAHFGIPVPGVTKYPSCGKYKLSHRVCKNCGSCNNEEVVSR